MFIQSYQYVVILLLYKVMFNIVTQNSVIPFCCKMCVCVYYTLVVIPYFEQNKKINSGVRTLLFRTVASIFYINVEFVLLFSVHYYNNNNLFLRFIYKR